MFNKSILIDFSGIYPSDCDDIRATQGGESGVYTIYLGECGDEKKQAVNVSCVMEDDAAWTVSAAICPNTT